MHMENKGDGLEGRSGRLFVTGDVHGGLHAGKLSSRRFPIGNELTKDDFVAIAGDFGRPWSQPVSQDDLRWLDWFERKPWTTLVADGNHENFDILNKLPVEDWHGGRVQKISPSIIHLMRGEVYEIAGMSVFAFGGARSTDRAYRTEGKNWWPLEMPTTEEMEHGEQNLERRGWKVDVVITHCAPDYFQCLADRSYRRDNLTWYLEGLRERLKFGRWFFGHYHVDADFGWVNASALYNRVVEVEAPDKSLSDDRR